MLVLASITVITLDYRGEVKGGISHIRNGIADALSPAQRGVAALLHPIGDVVSSAFHYGSLQTQNAELRNQVGQLTAQLSQAKYGAATDAEVLKLEGLPYAPNVPKVLGEVISQSTSNFADDVEISVGSSSGVGTGMPVVADGGLVGKVLSQSAATATVQLLTSSGNALSAEDLTTGAIIALDGQGSGSKLTSTQVTGRAPSVGDVVVTSGENAGAYPPDIPIGTVSSVASAPGGLNVVVHVKPAVDPSQLQMVSVIQWLPPA